MENSWYGQQLGVQTELPLITLLISLSQLICVKIWSNNTGKLQLVWTIWTYILHKGKE